MHVIIEQPTDCYSIGERSFRLIEGEVIAYERKEVQLPAGTVRYREAGDGRPMVFVHGYLVDGRLWDEVVDRLAASGYRCLAPNWPMGAHQVAMSPAADLSAPGPAAAVIASFLEALGAGGRDDRRQRLRRRRSRRSSSPATRSGSAASC